MSIDSRLAQVLEWLWAAALPAAVDAKARLLVLDTIGCVLAAAAKPKLQQFAARLAASDPGTVRVPGFRQALSAGSATALFSAAACWDEACEGLARAHGRPGVPVIAACTALSQIRSSSFEEVLGAIVAGYEVGGRLGETLRMQPGMHVDATWPSFGVAAAAARLLRGSASEALAAVRTAACQMPHSLYLPVKAGAEARNTYLGHAAQLGLLAASAALAGFSAPEGALAEIGARDPLGPGEWLILEAYLKPFAAVRHVHYGAAAALALRPQLVGRVDAIQRVELSTYAEALTYCGNRAPRQPIQAQFSLSFGVACALLTGELDPAAYAMNDRALEALETKVVLSEDAELTRSGRRGATLTVHFGNERLAHTVDRVAGDPLLPMTREQIVAKFVRYSGRTAGDAARILDEAGETPFSELSPA